MIAAQKSYNPYAFRLQKLPAHKKVVFTKLLNLYIACKVNISTSCMYTGWQTSQVLWINWISPKIFFCCLYLALAFKFHVPTSFWRVHQNWGMYLQEGVVPVGFQVLEGIYILTKSNNISTRDDWIDLRTLSSTFPKFWMCLEKIEFLAFHNLHPNL